MVRPPQTIYSIHIQPPLVQISLQKVPPRLFGATGVCPFHNKFHMRNNDVGFYCAWVRVSKLGLGICVYD